MSELPKPPHDNEEQASQKYERLRAIRNSQKELESNLDQQFLPDPAEETSAESLGGGYGAAPPPQPPAPKVPDYIAEQLPTDEHKKAAETGVPAARKALEDARKRSKSTPPSNPNTP